MARLGCDIGAIATKTVILNGNGLIAWDVTPNHGKMYTSAERSVENVLAAAGIRLEDIRYRGGTGWGQKYIPFPHNSYSMISCLAKGIHFSVPSVQTIVNIGGLSANIISLDQQSGRVLEYRTNDRCASGTGFFLDLAAQALELDVENLGEVALSAKDPVFISAQCAVFGESEIVTHVNDGAEVADIVAGITYSIGASLASMARRLSIKEDMVATGGVSKNKGVIRAIEDKIGIKIIETDFDSQLSAAVGAALLAQSD